MKSKVVRENEGLFEKVAWGRTKNLLGPENGGTRHLKINITEYAPGTEHSLHRHPSQEEVIYVLEGNGVSRTKEGDQPISAGCFAFVPANTDHATINLNRDRPMKAVIIKSPPAEEGKK